MIFTRIRVKEPWLAALALLIPILLSLIGGCAAPEEEGPTIDDHPADQIQALNTRTGTRPATGCAELPPDYVTSLEVRPEASMAEPAPRTPFQDPVFGTCLLRVTDRNSDLTPDDPSTGMKNEYSRVQSFNADNSYILVRSIEAEWYLYDASSLQPLGQLPLSEEPRWDAQDPELIYHIEETRLMAFSISEGRGWQVHDFAQDLPGRKLVAVWTRYEGSPSADGRFWGLMAEDEDWMTVALLVYDMTLDQVIAQRDTPGRPEIDSVTISPLGNYLLAYYDDACEAGKLGDDDHPCGLMVYDQSLENGRGLLRIIGHSDLTLDAQGREVLIFQDIDQDNIAMLDLESGIVTPLFPIDFSHSALGFHFSGRAFERPGWVLISTYNGSRPAATWMDDQVFALELKPNGRVVRLAHTHSIVDEEQEHDYWAEPHASANQDLTRILFTSNWGRSGTGEVEMYLIWLEDDWSSNLP